MDKNLLDSKRSDLQYKTNEVANIIVVLIDGNPIIDGSPDNASKLINKAKIRLREISEISEQLYNALCG